MTLHEAIEVVLREFKRAMKPAELADVINLRKLYTRKDHNLVTGSQISARVGNYPEFFDITSEGINLHDSRIKPFKDFSIQLLKFLHSIFPGNEYIREELNAGLLFFIYFNDELPTISKLGAKDLLVEDIRRFNKNRFDSDIFATLSDLIESSFSNFDAERLMSLIDRYDLLYFKPTIPEFSVLFNDVVNAYSWRNKYGGAQFSTPKALTPLIASLYLLDEKSHVFDPFAGRASLLTELIRAQGRKISLVSAGDINDVSVKLGSLNISATSLNNFVYKKGNAFFNWDSPLDADLLITAPPFGTERDIQYHNSDWRLTNVSDYSLNTIQLALYHLNPNGKAIILVPESTLFGSSKGAIEIKKHLVEHHLLDGVILLPQNAFKPYASVKTALVMINKELSSKRNGVFLYDAREASVENFKQEAKQIVSSFHNHETILDKSRWVHQSEIIERGFDLSVKPYLVPSLNEEGSVPLVELLDFHFIGNHVDARNLGSQVGLPYIQVGDLKADKGINSLDLSGIKSQVIDTELINQKVRYIPKGSVLLSKVGTNLKPTLFSDDVPAIASSNIIVLKPSSRILPEYLISQLQSEYVSIQVDAIRRYNAIPNINLKHFLGIKIRSIALQEQQEFLTKYYSKRIADVEKGEIKSKEDELFNIISRIKHEIKQPISSIGMDISVLYEYFEEKAKSKEPVSFDDFAVAPLPGLIPEDLESTRISGIFKRIKAGISETQDTLQKAEETLNLGKGGLKLEEIEIKKFIEESIVPLYQNCNCIITIEGKDQLIAVDKYQFKVLFKHLIDNAIKYGFDNSKARTDNIIKVQVQSTKQEGLVELQVMNNGTPFSKGFNYDSFTTRRNHYK